MENESGTLIQLELFHNHSNQITRCVTISKEEMYQKEITQLQEQLYHAYDRITELNEKLYQYKSKTKE
jgi:hypothetical protein